MTTSRLRNIKLKVIDIIGMYFRHSRLAPYLNGKKDEESPIIKIKINSTMRVLFAIIFNIDEYNNGRKSELLNFLEDLIQKDYQTNSSNLMVLNYKLKEVQDEVIKNMENNDEADFILPPDNMSSIDLARKMYVIFCEYPTLSFWRSPQELEALQYLTLNAMRIILSSGNFQKKLLQLLRLQKDVLDYPYGCDFVKLLEKILIPSKNIMQIFREKGAGESAQDLSDIIMNYYDDTPEIINEHSQKQYKIIRQVFFSRNNDEKTANDLSNISTEYLSPRLKFG